MAAVTTDDLADLLDAGAPTAAILAPLAALEASCPLLVPPGWTALLARLLVALDLAAAQRGGRVCIDHVREKFGSLTVHAQVVDGECSRGAAWLRLLVNRYERESESRCTICGRSAPAPRDPSRRWRSPHCGLHGSMLWQPLRPDAPDLSAHRQLRATAALDARGPWRIAQTYNGKVWRLPVRRGRHDALVSVRAEDEGAFVTAAITAWRGGPVRLSPTRLLAAEARLETAAAAALRLATPPTSSPPR